MVFIFISNIFSCLNYWWYYLGVNQVYIFLLEDTVNHVALGTKSLSVIGLAVFELTVSTNNLSGCITA